MTTLWHDLRHGLRLLGKNPGFALVAMASIAIGVGANAAMFGLADTLVLRPLTVPRASEIVTVAAVVPQSGFSSPTSFALSFPDYEDVRDQAGSFASLAGFRVIAAGFADRADQPPQRRFGMAVTGNLFDMLGVQAAHGRVIGPHDDRLPAREPVVVLDHDLWRQEFGADPAVVGRRIRVGGLEATVVGVMPLGFTGPDQFVQPAFYVPFAVLPMLQGSAVGGELERRDVRNVAVKGRLQPGVSVAQASEEASLIAARLERSYPATNRNQGLTVRTEFDARVQARPQLVVQAATLILPAIAVLLVACANVAGLLTSRAPVRAREMAMRMALGAGRVRLVRQLVVESLLIAAGGGAAGLLIGFGVIAAFQGLQLPTDVPLKLNFEMDDRVLVVGLVVATISAVGSSLIPAWRSTRTDLVSQMKSQTPDAQRSRLWGRNLLVCGQVGLSLVLLTVAVFLYRAYQGEYGRGPGFRTESVLLMSFQPELAGHDAAAAERFYDRLLDRVRELPGVRSAALTSSVPFDVISIENTALVPEGFQFPDGQSFVRVRSARVSEDYFDTLDIPLLSGRVFRSGDTPAAARVAVVNDTLASRYWPGQTAVGKRFQLVAAGLGASGSVDDASEPWVEIVGVAATTKYRSLAEGPTEFVYYFRTQSAATDSTLMVHAAAHASAMAEPLRAAVRALDPEMPVFGVRTLDDFYRGNTETFSTLLVEVTGGMGSMGLALAVVGLYGLVAYAASRRTREIGIRMAVGARAGSVLALVMKQGLLLATAGTVVGILASVATAKLLRAVFPFPGVADVDLVTYAIVVPALLTVTLLAAYLPARRAARTDPMTVLRQE